MLTKELEGTLKNAFESAQAKRHEFITVEHLLLALIDNASARAVMLACGCDTEILRGQLAQYIDDTSTLIPEDKKQDTQCTQAFQTVIQRAVFHAQVPDKKEVTGANLFVALFSEQDSHAVYLLNKQDVSRLDVVNYLAHGVSKHEQDFAHSSSLKAEHSNHLYKVILLNDDFTPMRFVVDLLMKFFGMSEDVATQIMLEVHDKGAGFCGAFSKVVAESIVQNINQYSREHHHQLLCSMEEM